MSINEKLCKIKNMNKINKAMNSITSIFASPSMCYVIAKSIIDKQREFPIDKMGIVIDDNIKNVFEIMYKTRLMNY